MNSKKSETMNLGSAASYLGMPKELVQKFAEKGIIPAKKIAGEWTFKRSTLASWRTNS